VEHPIAPFAVQFGEGTALQTPGGGVVTIKAATRATNGSLTVLEFLIGPKNGPALHTHLREDELWYVIEGDFRFKAGDAMLRASTGGMAFGPAACRTASRTSVIPRGGCW
jgi:mannose-6-phosphate isomerase-like protein (cupin superfamily)